MDKKLDIENIVISGGGSYIYCEVGALMYLDKHGYLEKVKNYAGSSAGAIICYFLVLGLKPFEIDYLFSIINTEKTSNKQFSKIFEEYGIDDGTSLQKIFIDLLIKKFECNDITFKQLFEKTNKSLHIIATCINDKDVECHFCHEKTPDYSVLKALRMSYAIPLYFTPVLDNDKYYIDGGLSNNYPIDLFPRENTLGITTVSTLPTKKPEYFEEYFIQLLKSIMYILNCKKIKEYKSNSIIIDILPDIEGINITPSYDVFLKLRKHGYKNAKKFFI